MVQESGPDLPLEGWLKRLGIDSLIQWDVLGFVCRHRTSLVGAEAIGRLLGYANDPVVAALDVLESLGFVERSRATHGVRLYQFAVPSDPARRDAFERLTTLGEDRAGRLRLIQVLRQRDQTTPEGHQAARSILTEARQLLPLAKLRPALVATPQSSDSGIDEGGDTWLKMS